MYKVNIIIKPGHTANYFTWPTELKHRPMIGERLVPLNGDDFFVKITNITHVDSEYTDFELEIN